MNRIEELLAHPQFRVLQRTAGEHVWSAYFMRETNSASHGGGRTALEALEAGLASVTSQRDRDAGHYARVRQEQQQRHEELAQRVRTTRRRVEL